MSQDRTVRTRVGTLELPTWLPAAPDRNPMFLEKRVYQGSSGRVYPLPFTDRIAEQPVARAWQAIWIENEYLRALLLPELGGRIHRLQDKTNGYDLIYYNPVIKPALVGLAGPWISGGIEFNWPQHHRPATFLPVDFEIERHPDGAVTVWCGDHDPLQRMRGLHGVCLHPGQACLELKVRVANRTPFVQTFLWWANVATRVHEAYQSFFPPDVRFVADHARRSMSTFPLARGVYYGIDYGERGRQGISAEERPRQFPLAHGHPQPALPAYARNDLSFYANIPVPTSYMCLGSEGDFFGGYDHRAQAGLVHVANHHLAPGKKQWTWGNHEFGYAWDRNLTEPDAQGEYAPYIELMAGVYTDNQPDFSFLQPGETKEWSQFWYPIQRIGPPGQANREAAVSLRLEEETFELGVAVTRRFPEAVVRLERADGSGAAEWQVNLVPGQPFLLRSRQARKPWRPGRTVLRVLDRSGQEIIAYRPHPPAQTDVPAPATEPPAPPDIESADELYVTGLHLDQYRHATRCPTLYWREALRRDAGDARCNNALGLWHLKRGEFERAEGHFRRAIERLTRRNANPYDGEAYYNLGLCLRFERRDAEAYAAFYKATWNQAWAGAAFHALAEMDCCRRNWSQALEHCSRSARSGGDNPRLKNLWALVLRQRGDRAAADSLLKHHRARDPLDWWTRHLLGEPVRCDRQTCLDLAHDYARAGFFAEAVALLSAAAARSSASRATTAASLRHAGNQPALPTQNLGAEPMVHYTLGWLEEQRGNIPAALRQFRHAAQLPPDYCFPARLEEIAVLQAAITAQPGDARAPYYLGNLLYDRRRYEEAIGWWERSACLDPGFSVVWRNLGLGYFNVRRQPAKARAAYDRAFRADPTDARLLYERDQLWKRLGIAPGRRLRELLSHFDLVRQRDDLSVELCALYTQTGRPERALDLIASRRFQPWEGGEGGPLGQWVRAHLVLGRRALANREPAQAVEHFLAALTAPTHLGEARHLLANQSDVYYWLGCALDGARRPPNARATPPPPPAPRAARTKREDATEAPGHPALPTNAREAWRRAANFKGDFQEMRVRTFSEMTYYSVRAWEKLGQERKAARLFRELLEHARRLEKEPAKIDYFATSLPAMLLFEDDLARRQETTALFLQAQARLGLGQRAQARRLLARVLQRDPNHALAADLAGECSDDRRPPRLRTRRSPHLT